MITGCRHFEDTGNYTFGCPEGEWRGRLDHRCWGRSANLLLYFTDLDTNKKYWLSVYFDANYTPRKAGPSFKMDVHEGEVFLLTTGITSGGTPSLLAASPLPEPEDGA